MAPIMRLSKVLGKLVLYRLCIVNICFKSDTLRWPRNQSKSFEEILNNCSTSLSPVSTHKQATTCQKKDSYTKRSGPFCAGIFEQSIGARNRVVVPAARLHRLAELVPC
jgi:hypothetical protein